MMDIGFEDGSSEAGRCERVLAENEVTSKGREPAGEASTETAVPSSTNSVCSVLLGLDNDWELCGGVDSGSSGFSNLWICMAMFAPFGLV